MPPRVQLIQKENFYYVLTFLDLENPLPKYTSPFPYNSENQQIQLQNARIFGKERADDLNIPLEENLSNYN